jgi:hypothetical protein
MLEPNALTVIIVPRWGRARECTYQKCSSHEEPKAEDTYFQPASLNRRAYIFPISPIPMIPMLLSASIMLNTTREGVETEMRSGHCEGAERKKQSEDKSRANKKFGALGAEQRLREELPTPWRAKLNRQKFNLTLCTHHHPDVED